MNQISLNEDAALEALYNGIHISKLKLDTDVHQKYNSVCYDLHLSEHNDPVFDYQFSYPSKYDNIDLEQYLVSRCSNDEEEQRVYEELMLFEMCDAFQLIKYLIYLVDYMNSKNIVWGVGRGSSVQVFIFYLIGIHKVNSIEYGLEYTDFFKIKE